MRVSTDGDATAAVASETERRALVAWVYDRLVETYGEPAWEPDGDALGGLIATVLSQHTSDVNSERAYVRLRQRFPSWEAVRDAPVTAVADAIRPGGLAKQKASRIQAILSALTPAADVDAVGTGVGAERMLPLERALDGYRGLSGPEPPEVTILRAKIAWSLYYGERYREALAMFIRASLAAPRSQPLHVGMGWCYLKLGQQSDARAAFQQAEKLGPNDEVVREGLRRASL